jgi:hypothetical protein
MQPRLDPVSTIYPGERIPDGQDERFDARVAAGLETNLRLQAEVGQSAGFEADNAAALAEMRRRWLQRSLEPRFRSRIVTIPVTDTAPTIWQPALGVGWVVAGIAQIPPVDSAFGTIPAFAFRIDGFDEIHTLYYRANVVPDQMRLGFRVTGTMQLSLSVVAAAAFPPTLIQQPALVFQFENWGRGSTQGD